MPLVKGRDSEAASTCKLKEISHLPESTVLIIVHVISGAKCFLDLLGIYMYSVLRPDSSRMFPYGEKRRKPSENVDNIIYNGVGKSVLEGIGFKPDANFWVKKNKGRNKKGYPS